MVANLFLGQETGRGSVLDEVHMEKEAWRLLRTLSAKIPSVRIPIASLSGGQRQTVAIARSLVGNPKVVMLDEPTAALGVAQTAEVLNLVERLRETGLAVILISHNMADVQAVADRIVVMRLGRNAAEFRVEEVTTEELVAAITGASDNVVAARAGRRERPARSARDARGARGARRARWLTPRPRTTGPETTPVAADLADERLIKEQGFRGVAKLQLNRLRSGDLGSLPVIVGLIVICIGFYSQNPIFLSSRNLISITQFAAPIGVIALGIVLVLLLGEIDLSVGSVSGLAAAVMAVLMVNHGHSTVFGIVAGLLVGLAIGLFYGLLFTRIGVPSFVFSLAGLLGFQGLLLYVLGKNGTINLPQDSFLLEFTRFKFVGDVASYVLVTVVVLAYLGAQLYGIRSRRKAGLSTAWLPLVVVKTGLLAAGLFFITYYVNIDRGFSYLWVFFVLLVVIMDFALRRTRWGRHVFAVGGNVEASRRSGIKVNRVYISVFALTSTLAALGGLLWRPGCRPRSRRPAAPRTPT